MSKLQSVISAFLLFAVTGANADLNINSNNKNSSTIEKKEEYFFEQGMALPEDRVQHNEKYPAAYSAPASILVKNSMDLNANVSFLYWYMGQDGMDVAFQSGVGAPGSIAYQKQGYNPGFQLGIGLDTKYDGWTGNAEYTWYHNSETLESNPGTYSFNDYFTVLFSPAYTSVSSKWKLHVDLLDVTAARPFYQGKSLTISPSGGLRALWIRQNEKITLVETGEPDSVSNSTSRSWALGAVANLNSRLLFAKGFRIDSNAGASLLYTNYTTIANSSSVSGAFFQSSLVNDQSTVRPTLDLGLGLGYGAYCFKNKFFIDLSAGYDFNIFWSQNVMRSFVIQSIGNESEAGDLILHGLTVNLRCDY